MSRKVAYVSRHEKCRIGGKRARNEVVVLWIRRSPWRRRWLEQQALCLQQTNQSIDLIGGKTEFRPRQNTFVFLGDLSGEARRYLAILHSMQNKRFIAEWGDQRRYNHVRVQYNADHFPATCFSRRNAPISPSISSIVSLSRPLFLAPAQACRSHSGGD